MPWIGSGSWGTSWDLGVVLVVFDTRRLGCRVSWWDGWQWQRGRCVSACVIRLTSRNDHRRPRRTLTCVNWRTTPPGKNEILLSSPSQPQPPPPPPSAPTRSTQPDEATNKYIYLTEYAYIIYVYYVVVLLYLDTLYRRGLNFTTFTFFASPPPPSITLL